MSLSSGGTVKISKAAVITTIGLMVATFGSLLMVPQSQALSLNDVVNGTYRGDGQPSELFDGNTAIIPRIINIMLFIVGILSIVMLIFGGIRYTISNGNKSKVEDAKNTILYSIVGLIVAILGYALVNWVIGVVGSGGSAGFV